MSNAAQQQGFPGSRWWRFDFHTHTPKSEDYPDKSVTPEQWLLNFMRVGIDCVAVTDHNSGAWVDELKQALASDAIRHHQDYRPLALFPGIELSVNNGVHLLAIFGPDKGMAEVEALRGAVGYCGTAGDSNAVTEDSLLHCVEKTLKAGAIPIPAHVDSAKGLLTAISDHHTESSVLPKLTAVEVNNTDSDTFKLNEAKLAGLSWVIGSDSHAPDAVGAYTWIKMSEPNIDGLRLALLDGELAVRRPEMDASGAVINPNDTAAQRLTELRVSQLKLHRTEDLTIRFNPWFNAIIGGRGSGKSTLLECLRIGLNRGDELNDLEELKRQFQSFRGASSGRDSDGVFTEDSELEVEYLKDGMPYRMHWRYGEPAPVLREQDGNDWCDVGQVIPSRFPVRIYSQKQVFEMAKNPHTLRALMDEDASVDISGWRAHWNELEAQFMSLRAEYRRLGRELAERERIEGELRDVQRKLKVFEQSHHADVLKAFQRSQRQQALVDRHLSGLGAQLNDWQTGVGDEQAAEFGFDPQGRFENPDADQQSVLAGFAGLATDLAGSHQQLRDTLTAMQTRLQRARFEIEQSAWQATARQHREAYEQLKSELQQQGIADPNVYGQLVQQQQVYESRLKELETKQVRQNELATQYQQVYGELKAWRLQLTQRRRDFLARVLGQNEHVKVELRDFGDRKRAEKDFRDLIGKSGNTYADDILTEAGNQGFIRDLYVTEDGNDDPSGVSDRIDTLKAELETVEEDLLLYTTIHKPLLRHLNGLRQQTPEVVDRLWCWFPEDEVEVKYWAPGNNGFRSVSNASAGQKTSAILSFLLAYGEEPLILDQPEDDLDNALIYELIVKQIRENKTRRQIIVVTHNPNIVVHGDAEWVLPLKYHKGSIRVERAGGLQESAVRQAICDIMEGGVEAFEQRYRKIHDQVSC